MSPNKVHLAGQMLETLQLAQVIVAFRHTMLLQQELQRCQVEEEIAG